MAIRLAATVEDEPTVTLCEWRIIRTDRDTLHFVGRPMGGLYYRMSSPIRHLDAPRLQGRTMSGRLYRLSGPAGLDLNVVRAALEPEIPSACEGWDDVTEELVLTRQ